MEKIRNGDIDVSKGKKGRKRNYQNFFQDDFLQEFVEPRKSHKTPEKVITEILEQGVVSCAKNLKLPINQKSENDIIVNLNLARKIGNNVSSLVKI